MIHTRSLCLGFGILCALALPAAAQATPDAGSAAPPANGSGETKANASGDESLQSGGAERPWAAGVSEAQRTQALTLFHEGNGYLNDGLFGKAAQMYRAALVHWNHPAIHYNLALALLTLEQPVEVYNSLVAATQYGEAPLDKEKYQHARDLLLAYSKLVANIEVSCDKPGAKVLVDGKQVFIAPGKYSQLVKPGKHVFIAEKEGYQARVKAPDVHGGDRFSIELKLYTASDLTRYKRRWDRTWMPYAVMGAGVVVGGIGGLLELSAQSSFKSYDQKVASCSSNNSGCPNSTPGLDSLRSSGDTKQDLAYVGYGIGIGAVAVGAVLAYLNRSEPYEIKPDDLGDRDDGSEPEPPHVTVAPIVSPTMAGAAVLGHF
jgi:hypothetical protein